MKESRHLLLQDPWLWYEEVRFPQPYRTKLHCHPAWQLTAALEKRTYFVREQRKIILSPGEWILFSPELPHSSGSDADDSQALQIFFRRFSPELLPEPARSLNFRRGLMLCGKVAPERIQAFAEEFRLPLRYPQSRQNLLAAELALSMLESIELEKSLEVLPNPKLLAAVEYMEQHCTEPLGVPDFAGVAGLSVSRFNDLFRRTTGRSPMDFFNEQRLGLAQTFLLRGFPVAECADRCGFSSAGYFCRKFKAYCGQTPGEFRKHPFAVGNEKKGPAGSFC